MVTTRSMSGTTEGADTRVAEKVKKVKRPSAEGETATKGPGWTLKTITKKERPMREAYSRFVKEKFMPQFNEKRAKGLCRRIDVYNVCKDAGEQWASMTDSEKAPYFAAVENELKIREVPNREVPYRPSKKTKRAEVETANKGPGWTLKTITKKERPMREAYSRFVKEKFMPQFHEKRAKGLCRRIDVYNVCKDAGEQWASMTDSEKAPYFAAVDTNLAELKVKKA